MNKAKSILLNLFTHPEMIEQYGKNAWDCGVRNHERDDIRSMLIHDFNALTNSFE